jgi:peptidyl-dipeptidase A
MRSHIHTARPAGLIAAMCLALALFAGAEVTEKDKMNQEFDAFLKTFEAKVIPMSREQAIASFDASISGKNEDYDRSADLQIQLSRIYSNREDFLRLKAWKEGGAITEPLRKRQLEILYDSYLGYQIPPEQTEAIIRLQTEIESKFNTFRAELDGKSVSDNELENLLKTSTDGRQLEAAWRSSKAIGTAVAEDVRRLARLRNEAARQLGFRNYHVMALALGEQDQAEMDKLFDELDRLTGEAFLQAKAEMDEILAKRCGIPKDQLMPWHYQNRFFQEAPKIYSVDLDRYYKDKNIVTLGKQYYQGIGLPLNDIVKRSDLYEKPGKYQHAYCIDVDREGDVRIVCNIQPTQQWMDTFLHESGHAVYDKWNDPKLPWLLREPAHTFTTEAIAMMFGRLASNPLWLEAMAGVPTDEAKRIEGACARTLRLEQLVFSRWTQVMYRFERGLYENPDQDLNALWWSLVEKYQGLKRPDKLNGAEWASKIHVATVPAYYHNYQLGALLASQLAYYISNRVLEQGSRGDNTFIDKKAVGEYLIRNVFKPGRKYEWNEMIRRATGEPLTPKYFSRQFVK